MLDIVVTRNDIKAVEKFLEEGILVQEMNKRGLSIGAMALVLTGIEKECNRIWDEINSKEVN